MRVGVPTAAKFEQRFGPGVPLFSDGFQPSATIVVAIFVVAIFVALVPCCCCCPAAAALLLPCCCCPAALLPCCCPAALLLPCCPAALCASATPPVHCVRLPCLAALCAYLPTMPAATRGGILARARCIVGKHAALATYPRLFVLAACCAAGTLCIVRGYHVLGTCHRTSVPRGTLLCCLPYYPTLGCVCLAKLSQYNSYLVASVRHYT